MENIILLVLLILLLALVAGQVIAGFVRWMNKDD